MLRLDTHPAKNRLALLMLLLVLISAATASFPTQGMQAMGSAMAASPLNQPGMAQAMNHEAMDHQMMNHEAMVASADGCPPGECCMDSCGQAGIVASPMIQSVPVSRPRTLSTLASKSRPSGSIYRPPRFTA